MMTKIFSVFIFRLSILMLFVCSVFVSASGQNSPVAKKAYDKGMKLFEKKKYKEVPEYLLKAISAEKELGDSMDRVFIGGIFHLYARFFLSEEYYGIATQFFFASAINYQLGGDTANAETDIRYANMYSDSAQKYQSQYYARDSLQMESFRMPISSILKVSGDTTWFSTNLGVQDSLKLGSTGSVITIYDKKDPRREVEYVGAATLTTCDKGKSEWYVIFDPDFKPKNISIQKGDLLYTKLPYSNSSYDGILGELTKYHVIFKDGEGTPMYNQRLIQEISSQKAEDAIIEMMRNTVRHTSYMLYEPGGDNSESLDSGAFVGYNMWEAMQIATTYDIKVFLRFVADFPGKYMGRYFRIDETFATWVINHTPTAEEEAKHILADYKSIKNETDLEHWIATRGKYLSVAEFDYSEIYNMVSDYTVANKHNAADSLADRWIYITQKLGMDSMLDEFRILKARILSGYDRTTDAIKIYEEIIKNKPNHLNAHWYLGHAYLDNEDFTPALKEYEYIMTNAEWFAGGYGSYGWTLLKLARNQKAFEYLKKAYEMDSTDATYIMNYAHVNMIMGKPKEARRLYIYLLDHIPDEETFSEGLIADFDEFIDNGRKPDEFKVEKSNMLNEWEKQYQFKVKGNELFERGKTLEDRERYADAAKIFDEAIAQEKQGLIVRHRLLRNYHRWAAYNYYKEKNHQEALKRYSDAWHINRLHLQDPELEIQDLTAVSNEYSWLNNDLRESMYRKMQHAAQRKFQNQQRSNDLYMISIGSNGMDEGYEKAESDAKRIAEVVSNKARLIFDNSYVSIFNQANCVNDTIKKSVEHVISNSKPGDCFVFYYSGFTQSDKIIVNNDTISNKQMLAWLSSMSATKKMVVIDAQNESLVSDFIKSQQENRSDFTTESVVFLISDGRVEMPEADGGLFTSYLVDGINGEAAMNWKNSFTETGDQNTSMAYVTSKSLEGYMYGNMSSGNLQFDLKSYSSGIDFPITFVNALSYSVDTIPPMIYIPNTISADGKRGGKTKIVTISKNVGGQALDESGIESIQVNGHDVSFSQNGKFNLNENFTKAWTKLVITATDKKGNVTRDSFIVNKSDDEYADPTLESATQTNYALLFATSNYDEWGDLVNPKKDVYAIANLLTQHYGFKVQIVVDTTVEGMKTILLEYMKKQYSPKDQLFVFFAGHGHYDPYRGGHIVGKDSKLDDNTLSSYLRFKHITEDLNNIYSCKHILLAFDVCFGGAAFDKQDVVNYSGSSLRDILNNRDAFIEKKLNTKTRLYMTSGSIEYVPDQSVFAQKIIETLKSKGTRKNGLLTFDDFTDNLQTIASMPESQRPTTPRYGTFGDNQNEGDFIFIYSEEEKPKSHDMKKEKLLGAK